MIMAIFRNLSIFVLLIQLVNFSTANIEGDLAENLGNASTISLHNEPNESLANDLEKVRPLQNIDNMSLPLETSTSLSGLIEEEMKIESELKNVLEQAALSGQLIVLSNSQNEKSNLNNITSGPLVMIEDSSTASQSLISQSRTNDDQEIAQSQVRTRTRPRDYDNHEDIENIEDLLAIAEYEPQKLDARKDDVTSTETSIAPTRCAAGRSPQARLVRYETLASPGNIFSQNNVFSELRHSLVESTSHRFPEETLHYDVPRGRNLSEIPKRPTSQARWSTTPKTYLDDISTFSTPTEPSGASIQEHKDPTVSRVQLPEYNYKAERRKSSSPSNFREKLPSPQEPWLRGPRHLKPAILSPSPTDPPTLVVPRMPNGDSEYSIVNRSQLGIVRNASGSRRREFRPLQRATSPANLLLTYPTVSTNKIPQASQREYRVTPTLASKQSLPANRRNDNYFDPEVPEIRSTLKDHQPSYFKRYHVPSPVPERLPNPYPYPTIPTATNEPHTPARSTENSSVESDDPEDKAYDYYEDSIEQGQPSQPKRHPIENPREATSHGEIIPTYDSYENKVDPNSPKLYQNGADPLPNSQEPDYDSYETDEVTTAPKLRSSQPELHPTAEKLPVVAANRFVAVPKRPIDHSDLKSTIDPSRETNLAKTPNYPYRNVYSSKKPIVADVRNIENKSETVLKHLQPFYQPKKAYERSEDSEDRTSSLGLIQEPLPRRNVDAERNVSPDVNKNHRLANIPNRQRTFAKENGQDHRTQSENALAFSVLPPVTSFNPQSTFVAPVQLANPGHRESSPVVNRYVASDNKVYSPTSSTQRQKFESFDGQTGGQIPSYTFYDSWKSINAPVRPASNARLPDTYESRVRPSEIPEQQKPLPSPTSTRKTTSSNFLNDHHSQQPRILPARNHVEPAESVHRSNTVPDAQDYEDEVPASSGHEEHHEAHAESRKDEGGDEESEKGGGEKHEEGHHNSSGEKGEKDYKEWHEYDKGKKGHHDKEHHDNEYHEEKGGKKKHEEESGYHKEHHHGEKGSKDSEFGEEGKHEKGHSTKGEHVIHKKDEYEKKTEFYDESHEEDGDEKEGEYHYEHEHKKGGHEKIGHHDSAFNVDKYGEKGEHEKGQHWHETKGHEKKDGHQQDHSHEEKYGKKGGHEEGEKWSHNNGDKEQR